MGTAPWIEALSRRCDRKRKRVNLSTKDTKGRVTGKGDELEQSEQYCVMMGNWVSELHQSWTGEVRVASSSMAARSSD